MKNMLTRVVKYLVLFPVVSLLVAVSIACTCDGMPTVEENYKHADYVVRGHVVSERTVWLDTIVSVNGEITTVVRDTFDLHVPMPSVHQYTLIADTIYKGDLISDTLLVYTGVNSAACGVILAQGKNYIVYGTAKCDFTYFGNVEPAALRSGSCWTSNCSRTGLYNADEAISLTQLKGK